MQHRLWNSLNWKLKGSNFLWSQNHYLIGAFSNLFGPATAQKPCEFAGVKRRYDFLHMNTFIKKNHLPLR